jgi:hypothetical protein
MEKQMQTQDGFKMFNLDKSLFEGYLSEVEDGVFISNIKSKDIGKGNFSKLIKQLKKKYNWIKIPTPSIMMKERSLHLEFIEKEEWFGEPFNEMGIVMFWSKKINQKETRQNV